MIEPDTWVLPAWCTEIRPHQIQAVEQIIEAYRAGVKMVVLDAPTGAGKTLIAELVRQELNATNLYVCSDKALQNQYLDDFPDSRVIKGRTNYTPIRKVKTGEYETTCDDCKGVKNCPYCPTYEACPYVLARDEAIDADTAVLNSSYYIAELNGPGRFRGRRLAVFDEADTLEQVLMRTAEVVVSRARAKKLHVTLPAARAQYKTVVQWVKDDLIPAVESEISQIRDDPKEKASLGRFKDQWVRFVESWEAGEPWVRDIESGTLRFRPVVVDGFGKRMVWQHADRFLLMSATVLDAESLLKWTGWDRPFEVVKVPMTFPVENRPVLVLPVADMSRRGKVSGGWETMGVAVQGVLERHEEESVLVHSHSYELTKLIVEALQTSSSRPVLTYLKAKDKDDAVHEFRRMEGDAPVLVAPSLGRGVDLPDDLCRVVVVAKIPYASLGDKQISARLHDTEDGQLWYTLQAMRELVQMTGRGVRSKSDWCVSYVLDEGMVQILKKTQWLLPDWWCDAMATPFSPTDLLMHANGHSSDSV